MGTYGVGSAGYWWGRLAAAVGFRLVYYISNGEWGPGILLYADDWQSIAGREAEIVHTGVNILILWSLGVPFK